MRKLAIAAAALMLASCASMPKVENVPKKVHMAKPINAAPKQSAVAPDDKPQTFKQRWYDRFKTHPKWFHG